MIMDNLQKTDGNAALPCPFCGSTNVEAHTYSDSTVLGTSSYVQCNNCSTTGPELNVCDEAAAFEEWNRRSADTCSRQCEGTAYRIELRQMKSLFAELLDQLGESDRGDGNAPGHAHEIPGIWDDDNGKLAGKPCAWCAIWSKAKALGLVSNAGIHRAAEGRPVE